MEMNKPTKKELLEMLQRQIEVIESLPATAMLSPINHYDYHWLMTMLLAIHRIESEKVGTDEKLE
jgi:hypothetical protein